MLGSHSKNIQKWWYVRGNGLTVVNPRSSDAKSTSSSDQRPKWRFSTGKLCGYAQIIHFKSFQSDFAFSTIHFYWATSILGNFHMNADHLHDMNHVTFKCFQLQRGRFYVRPFLQNPMDLGARPYRSNSWPQMETWHVRMPSRRSHHPGSWWSIQGIMRFYRFDDFMGCLWDTPESSNDTPEKHQCQS